MKKYYRILSIIVVFIFVFSYSGNFIHAENGHENSRDNSLISPISIDQINYQVNKNLTEEQVHERFKEINSTYKLNEPFSLEDTEFIRAYASLSRMKNNDNQLQSNIQPMSNVTTERFSQTASKYGVDVSFNGSLFTDIGLVQHSYGGDVTTSTTNGHRLVKKIETTITNVAYGLLGSSGTYVGIVYDDSTSSNVSGSLLRMNRKVEYGAVAVLYTYTNAYSIISTSSGNFTIHAF